METIMPIQPIENYRFIPNRIVEMLLETSTKNMNDIAVMDFTDQERMQFAQLIGYSLSGFAELSYADDETYETASNMGSSNENEARNEVLRGKINDAKKGLKIAVDVLFEIYPDDLD